MVVLLQDVEELEKQHAVLEVFVEGPQALHHGVEVVLHVREQSHSEEQDQSAEEPLCVRVRHDVPEADGGQGSEREVGTEKLGFNARALVEAVHCHEVVLIRVF
jgi:hypothetical protein